MHKLFNSSMPVQVCDQQYSMTSFILAMLVLL